MKAERRRTNGAASRENHEGVLGEFEPVEGGENLTDAPIQFTNEVAVFAGGVAREVWVGHDGAVDGVGREVEEERRGAVRLDPAGGARRERFHHAVGLPWFLNAGRLRTLPAVFHDDRLTGNVADHRTVFDEAVRSVRDIGRHAEIVVEAELAGAGRERRAPVGDRCGRPAGVPLAEGRSRVALVLAQRSERRAIGFDVERGPGGEHFAVLDAGAPIVAARHQSVARGRAHRAGRVAVREAPAFLGEPVMFGVPTPFAP